MAKISLCGDVSVMKVGTSDARDEAISAYFDDSAHASNQGPEF
jgi:hypothetical protein